MQRHQELKTESLLCINCSRAFSVFFSLFFTLIFRYMQILGTNRYVYATFSSVFEFNSCWFDWMIDIQMRKRKRKRDRFSVWHNERIEQKHRQQIANNNILMILIWRTIPQDNNRRAEDWLNFIAAHQLVWQLTVLWSKRRQLNIWTWALI